MVQRCAQSRIPRATPLELGDLSMRTERIRAGILVNNKKPLGSQMRFDQLANLIRRLRRYESQI
jgi:hypothetical protein